jgi:hypothetical protein
VILAAENVVDLQFFLMDAAKRYVAAGGPDRMTDRLFGSAAALDYALLLASQNGDETLDDASAAGQSVRETMTRAAHVALDVVDRMLKARDDVFADFVERHVRAGGLFDVIAALQKRGVVTDGDVAFRTLTLASDLIERRR